MLSLPIAFTSVIGVFAPVFSRPVWQHVKVLLTGAVLAPGKRTVTAVLHIMGRSAASDFQTYHRVLNRAVWSPLNASRLLLRLLVAVCIFRGVVVLGLDDTIERRRGEQITAKGIYRDPVRSSHAHMVKASGLRWLACMLLTPLAWANRVWALPFLTVLCPSERFYAQRRRRHQTLTERAWQMIRLVVRWLPGQEIAFVTDSSFAALELLDKVKTGPRASLITRLRLDAALDDPPPPRPAGTEAALGSKASADRRWKRWWPMRRPVGPRGLWSSGRAQGHGRWRSPRTPPCGITRVNLRLPSAGC